MRISANTCLWSTGAKKAREVVFSVLCDACADGDLSIPEAIEAAKDIFSQNAIQFYKIDHAVKSYASENSVSSKFVKVKSNDSENDVSLVRVFWSDASGQQRCRVSSFLFNFIVRIEVFLLSSRQQKFAFRSLKVTPMLGEERIFSIDKNNMFEEWFSQLINYF